MSRRRKKKSLVFRLFRLIRNLIILILIAAVLLAAYTAITKDFGPFVKITDAITDLIPSLRDTKTDYPGAAMAEVPGVSADFKSKVDAYTAFFDHYYNQKDGATGLIAEYTGLYLAEKRSTMVSTVSELRKSASTPNEQKYINQAISYVNSLCVGVTGGY